MVCIENVSKEFRKNTVLEQINLEMKNGKIYGLVGRNGSGKTVLIKMIAGLCEPSEGEIFIDGEKRKKALLQNLWDWYVIVLDLCQCILHMKIYIS